MADPTPPKAPEAPNANLTKDIATRIRTGLKPAQAAASLRVTPERYEEWMKKGKEGGKGTKVYIDFRIAVLEAEADMELTLIGAIRRQAADSWQAGAWLAERLWPERYVRKSVNGQAVEASRPPEDEENGRAGFSSLDNVTPIKKNRG